MTYGMAKGQKNAASKVHLVESFSESQIRMLWALNMLVLKVPNSDL